MLVRFENTSLAVELDMFVSQRIQLTSREPSKLILRASYTGNWRHGDRIFKGSPMNDILGERTVRLHAQCTRICWTEITFPDGEIGVKRIAADIETTTSILLSWPGFRSILTIPLGDFGATASIHSHSCIQRSGVDRRHDKVSIGPNLAPQGDNCRQRWIDRSNTCGYAAICLEKCNRRDSRESGRSRCKEPGLFP